MADHELRISRYQCGQQTYGNIRGAAGMRYGTEGKCSCGEWGARRNVAPSKGGRKEIEEAHADHVAGHITPPEHPIGSCRSGGALLCVACSNFLVATGAVL